MNTKEFVQSIINGHTKDKTLNDHDQTTLTSIKGLLIAVGKNSTEELMIKTCNSMITELNEEIELLINS